MFGHFDLISMNETDVREIIIRPLLHALGFRQGTQANILTERTLRYSKMFLGRKKATDAELQGRADYICEYTPYARWTVEAKPPSQPLSIDDAQQAHSYSAHPDVGAFYYMLINGRQGQVFQISHPDKPLFEWAIAETGDVLPILKSFLSPTALQKKFSSPIDLGKPIAEGLRSKLEIIGGDIVYDEHISEDLPGDLSTMDGMRQTVSGIGVERTGDGLIMAQVLLKSAHSTFDAINQAVGLGTFVFKTSDEFVSTDVEVPTLFTNIVEVNAPQGMSIPAGFGRPAMVLPVSFKCICYTEAVGFVHGERFQGTFSVDYQYTIDTHGLPLPLPAKARMRGLGHFDLLVR
ncbi:type I restriction enzyme HsdR N-terminal domain-containing protein [Rhizobium sp. 32-5/1]|uniref:type I restriction enzyme HsdR N-terminal domain-containing protein n=1 Tax=Rhizobium sp. 32-5/1 TaxID=3019602 RepID=UPI00240D620A|nr:type I restriction enzyme HsdR N-terminal domain-containing protein [Rhizobium sp. 32-5/1]WEZ84624.1 type I restriction enzyme HsdR N-terminal domain-containing protein [Rhizobium sp. 32-5/1]